MSRKTIRTIFLVAAVVLIIAATVFVATRPHGQIFQWIHHVVRHGGYPVLFLLLFCCGLGLPLPEDIPLIVSGILIQNEAFSLGIAAGVAWCGIIGGDCMLYMLGRNFGNDIVNVPVIGRHINARRLAMVEQWFVRWGIWVVAVGRMFAGVRGAMVVVAGASRFNFWKFIAADGVAAIASGGLFVLLGYKFAQHRDRLHHLVEQIKGGMLIGAFVVLVLIGGYVWQRKRTRSARTIDVLPPEPTDPPGRSARDECA
jgi:membrane protein DedA with SNARE-associated domain